MPCSLQSHKNIHGFLNTSLLTALMHLIWKKDIKNLQYIILCGRVVCQSWLGVLAISTSRFCDIRKEFITVGSSCQKKKAMSLLPKSMKCIEWMRSYSYFDQVGDKRMESTCLHASSLKKQSVTSWPLTSQMTVSSVFYSSTPSQRHHSQGDQAYTSILISSSALSFLNIVANFFWGTFMQALKLAAFQITISNTWFWYQGLHLLPI